MTNQAKIFLGIGAGVVLYLLYRQGTKAAAALKGVISDTGKDVAVDLSASAAAAPAIIQDLMDDKGQVKIESTNPVEIQSALNAENAPSVADAMPVQIEQETRSISILTAVSNSFPVPRAADGATAARVQSVQPFGMSITAAAAGEDIIE